MVAPRTSLLYAKNNVLYWTPETEVVLCHPETVLHHFSFEAARPNTGLRVEGDTLEVGVGAILQHGKRHPCAFFSK